VGAWGAEGEDGDLDVDLFHEGETGFYVLGLDWGAGDVAG